MTKTPVTITLPGDFLGNTISPDLVNMVTSLALFNLVHSPQDVWQVFFAFRDDASSKNAVNLAASAMRYAQDNGYGYKPLPRERYMAKPDPEARVKYNWRQDTPWMQFVVTLSAIEGSASNAADEVGNQKNQGEYILGFCEQLKALMPYLMQGSW